MCAVIDMITNLTLMDTVKNFEGRISDGHSHRTYIDDEENIKRKNKSFLSWKEYYAYFRYLREREGVREGGEGRGGRVNPH